MGRTLAAVVVLVGLLSVGEAQAYLDPGTGSAALQIALAGLVGVLFLLKTYWRQIVAFFSGKPDEVGDSRAPSGDDEK